MAAGQQILPLIDHLARISRRAADAAMADGSLRPRHVIALTLLSERGPMTQHAVGAALSLDPSNVVGLLNELEERGLITRRRDPADRRRHIVEVSATGADELTQTYTQLGLVEDELFKTLTLRSAVNPARAARVRRGGLSPSHQRPGPIAWGRSPTAPSRRPRGSRLDPRLPGARSRLPRARIRRSAARRETAAPLIQLHRPGAGGHDDVVSSPTDGESLGALRFTPRAAPRWRAPVTSFWSPMRVFFSFFCARSFQRALRCAERSQFFLAERASRARRPQRRLLPRPDRPDRGERRGQVHPAGADRRPPAAVIRIGNGDRGRRLPAADPHPRRRRPGSVAARHRRRARRDRRHRGGRRQPGDVRRGRRRLGRAGAGPRRGSPGSAWPTSAWTTRLAGCPAARRS